MDIQDATRKPGRPTTGKALSPAERMRRTRERARVAVLDDDWDDLSGLSDTGLFEVLQVAYRRRLSYVVADVARELFRRMDAAGFSVTVAETSPAPEIATGADSHQVEHQFSAGVAPA